MVTAFVFFLVGGALAELIRTELYSPGLQVVGEGTLQRAVHDARHHHAVPLPRALRASAWPTTSCRCRSARATWRSPGSTPCPTGSSSSAGSRCSPASSPPTAPPTSAGPATRRCRSSSASPGPGADLWLIGVLLTGLSGILTGVNIIATVFTMRAPGMTMFRMPIFTWNMLVTSVLILIAFPVLTARRPDAVRRPAPRRPHLRRRPAAGRRSCGSTCSGSSATPRSTSSSCRTSA